MKAKLVFVSEKKQSEHGGDYYVLRFKADDGQDYSTHIYLNMRNWPAWEPLLQPGFDKTTLLEGFVPLKGYKDRFDGDWPPSRLKAVSALVEPRQDKPEAVQATIFPEKAKTQPVADLGGLTQSGDPDRFDRQREALAKARQEAGVR